MRVLPSMICDLITSREEQSRTTKRCLLEVGCQSAVLGEYLTICTLYAVNLQSFGAVVMCDIVRLGHQEHFFTVPLWRIASTAAAFLQIRRSDHLAFSYDLCT